jgi:hypothetical protein
MLSVFGPDLLQSDWGDFARLRLPKRSSELPVVRAGGMSPACCPGTRAVRRRRERQRAS